MGNYTDPRLIATRTHALEAAQQQLREHGISAVTHGSVSAQTGISRSTLYRHWPTLDDLRNDAFREAATPPNFAPLAGGPLRTDLLVMLGNLLKALNESTWGQIAPQVVAAAAVDDEARVVLRNFMADRMESVNNVFTAAKSRGEIDPDLDVRPLIEAAIAVPYFRKLITGHTLDQSWLEEHVDLICRMASPRD